MKKSAIMTFAFLSVLISLSAVSAVCNLDVSIINQDPYPAIPSDYVKVVFQIEGISNPECGVVSFELKENYPFSLDPNVTNKVEINAGTYSRTYSSFYLATYKLRVDDDAIDGNNPIEVVYSSKNGAELLKEFNIYVEDTKADFEVYVKDYSYSTKALTLEILNIEEVDVEALSIEIPKQENFEIKGANRKVIGDLDSNEYTTAEFEAILPEGETNINLKIIYTDSINVRREINKTIHFDFSYFSGLQRDKKSSPYWLYLVIVLLIIWFVWRRIRKARMKKKMQKK